MSKLKREMAGPLSGLVASSSKQRVTPGVSAPGDAKVTMGPSGSVWPLGRYFPAF